MKHCSAVTIHHITRALLHGTCVGEEAGARNRVFFRVGWLQAAVKGTSSVPRLRFGSCQRVIGSPLVFCTAGMRIAL